MSQTQKLGYQIDKLVHVQLLKPLKLFGGMLADVQARQCDPTANMQGFSRWKREADDHDVILVMSKSSVYIEVREYIGEAHMSLRLLSGFLAVEHSGNLLRSHQPSVAATSMPLTE